MPEKERSGWFEREKSVEERLAESARREEVEAHTGQRGAQRRYPHVGEYDPVLRWHCRLDEPKRR